MGLFFYLRVNSSKTWVQKNHMGTSTYSDVRSTVDHDIEGGDSVSLGPSSLGGGLLMTRAIRVDVGTSYYHRLVTIGGRDERAMTMLSSLLPFGFGDGILESR